MHPAEESPVTAISCLDPVIIDCGARPVAGDGIAVEPKALTLWDYIRQAPAINARYASRDRYRSESYGLSLSTLEWWSPVFSALSLARNTGTQSSIASIEHATTTPIYTLEI